VNEVGHDVDRAKLVRRSVVAAVDHKFVILSAVSEVRGDAIARLAFVARPG
jgi:hypothetical protein